MNKPSEEQLLSVNIGRLYWAATSAFPDHADMLSDVAKSLAGSLETLNVQSALAGDPAALSDSLYIGREVHELLRRLVIDLDHGATALLNTAKGYVSADTAAGDEARKDLEAIDLTLPRSLSHHAPPVAPTSRYDDDGATTTLDVFGIHIPDIHIGKTPDPTDVGYEQTQQMDGPDLPDDPTLPGEH